MNAMSSIGAVTISPSGTSLVCDRDQLELICTVAESDADSLLLEWTITAVTIFRGLHRAIEATSPSSDQTFQIMINSTTFTFSRISTQNEFPLVSRLLINPLTTDLNGIMINCANVLTMETASTTVYVLNRFHNGMTIIHTISRNSSGKL